VTITIVSVVDAGGPAGGGAGAGGVTCPTDGSYAGDATTMAGATPQASPLRGSVGCVTAAAQALRTDSETATNIYGPLEAGFSSTVPNMSCLGSNTVPAGVDTQAAEWMVHNLCSDTSIQVLDCRF
jgi:hypothetical protein